MATTELTRDGSKKVKEGITFSVYWYKFFWPGFVKVGLRPAWT